MEAATVSRLVDLNHLFYQSFAGAFAATRQRLQPGVRRVLEEIHPGAHLLDLGCGNGEVARFLASRDHQGSYLGLDFSPALLEAARGRLADAPPFPARFQVANLASRDWDAGLPAAAFDWVLVFAVLHHLPGEALRRSILQRARLRLVPGGRLALSVWQFLHSPRLAARVLPWHKADLDPEQVDSGDYLLDWRAGGLGLRYVHHFSETELHALAAETGFEVLETFASDGKEGNLGLYQTWKNR